MEKRKAINETPHNINGSGMRVALLHDMKLGNDQLHDFIQKVDSDFSPPLSVRVDLKGYAEKLYREAVTVVVVEGEEQEVLGALSFYCKPESYDKASLSFMAVLSSARGKGYARAMMRYCQEYIQKSGMHSIETRTWRGNTPMIQLLEEFGYRFIREEVDLSGRPSVHYLLSFDRSTEIA